MYIPYINKIAKQSSKNYFTSDAPKVLTISSHSLCLGDAYYTHVYNFLFAFCSQRHFISDSQFGFCPSFTTVSALLSITHEWLSLITLSVAFSLIVVRLSILFLISISLTLSLLLAFLFIFFGYAIT